MSYLGILSEYVSLDGASYSRTIWGYCLSTCPQMEQAIVELYGESRVLYEYMSSEQAIVELSGDTGILSECMSSDGASYS